MLQGSIHKNKQISFAGPTPYSVEEIQGFHVWMTGVAIVL